MLCLTVFFFLGWEDLGCTIKFQISKIFLPRENIDVLIMRSELFAILIFPDFYLIQKNYSMFIFSN